MESELFILTICYEKENVKENKQKSSFFLELILLHGNALLERWEEKGEHIGECLDGVSGSF
jgi:hypothetical protein